jgi:hypothetical protein
MSLDTFTNLKTAVASWLHRSDLTTTIPDFITLAETQFNRTLRVRQMETLVTAAAAKYMTLPLDYLALRRAPVNTSIPCNLELLSADEINRRYTDVTGAPRGYALVGNVMQLGPEPDSTGYTIEYVYYAKIPALATAVPTNWVLQQYPDLYLYGALMAAAEHIQDDPRVPLWQSKYLALLGDVNRVDKQSRASGAQPYMRAA